MKFSFTSLGTASALPAVNRFPGAHVLDVHGRLFLIDCGEGCQIQLRKFGFSFARLSHIFISHIHGDHVFGIFGLLSTMSLLGRTADLYIFAPQGFAGILEMFNLHFGEGIKYKIIHEVLIGDSQRLIYQTKGTEVYSFPLNHRVDCYGFRFAEKIPPRNVYKHLIEKYQLSLSEIASLKRGEDLVRDGEEVVKNEELTYLPYQPRSFAYCSDTAPFPGIHEYVRDVDLLYHEATFTKELTDMARTTMHSTASQAAKVALRAGAKKLIIGHFSARYKDSTPLLKEARELFPNTFAAVEGMEFEIELKQDSGV